MRGIFFLAQRILPVQMLVMFRDIQNDIDQWLDDSIDDIVSAALDSLFSALTESLTDSLNEILTDINESVTQDFWSNSVVSAFVDFSAFCCWGIFVASLVFLIVDIAHEYASGKAVIWANVVKGFLYGVMFAVFSYRIPPISCQVVSNIMSAIDFEGISYSPDFTLQVLLGPIVELLLTSVLFVAALVMLFLVSARQAMVLVHLMTASFYIPEIVRGDTTKMGDWLRQLVALVGTLFFQYIMFMGGVQCLCIGSFFAGVAFISGAFAAPKVLERFGWQNSARSVLGTAQSAAMTGFYIKGLIR